LKRRFICLLIIPALAAACSLPLGTPPAGTPAPMTATPVSTVSFVVNTPRPLPTAPSAEPPACPDAPMPRMILHERGRVLPDDPRPINLRGGPGTDNNTLTSITILEVFYVLNGPVCNGDYAWYEIEYGPYRGWIAEGDETSYYVEPYLVD
jgi:hypothetical protein